MAKKGKSKGKESLIVGSKVKAYVKSKKCQTSGDALAALNDAVHDLLACAAERAKANGRVTVKPQDL